MKVCTDACLFGAWAAHKIQNEQLNIGRILDIGTGTGLLSLMVAQKNNGQIDAVEIDTTAALQATENFKASPWKERLHIHNVSIQQSNLTTQYDFIISNPPFYNNDLKSNDEKRNLALHATNLSTEELLAAVEQRLYNTGHFAILLPYKQVNHFEKLCNARGYMLSEKVAVKQTPQHSYFRIMLWFNKARGDCKETEITIMQSNNNYSEEFVQLLKDYYLYL